MRDTKKDIKVRVPITENDIEDVFKSIVYGDIKEEVWSFKATNGQNVVITFCKEEEDG